MLHTDKDNNSDCSEKSNDELSVFNALKFRMARTRTSRAQRKRCDTYHHDGNGHYSPNTQFNHVHDEVCSIIIN